MPYDYNEGDAATITIGLVAGIVILASISIVVILIKVIFF